MERGLEVRPRRANTMSRGSVAEVSRKRARMSRREEVGAAWPALWCCIAEMMRR